MCKLIEFQSGKYVADIKYKYIQNIIEQAKECKNINRIMLFGSSTEERCTDKSDIDIAVFGEMTKSKYLGTYEFKKFQGRLFLFDLDQDYDILYFRDGQDYQDEIMSDIECGTEIYRRVKV